jgi:single-strand DNA-binding protein
MQKIHLIGYVGKDADLQYSGAGSAFSRFTLGVNTNGTKDGEKTQSTTWYNVTVFGSFAEKISQYIKSGKQVYVDGDLSAGVYEASDGSHRVSLNVISNNIVLLGSKESSKHE